MNILHHIKWPWGNQKDIGGGRSPRPYRDWYLIVGFGLIILFVLVYWYAEAMLTITRHEDLSGEAVVEKSVEKVSPQTAGRAAELISRANDNFAAILKGTSTLPVDPSR